MPEHKRPKQVPQRAKEAADTNPAWSARSPRSREGTRRSAGPLRGPKSGNRLVDRSSLQA
jgi:hypothetical protein